MSFCPNITNNFPPIHRSVISIIVIIGVAFSFAGCRGGRRTVEAGQGRVFEISATTLSPGFADTLKMGTVREGEKIALEFSLKNGFAEPFVVKNVVSGCGCTVFGYSREPVMPGGAAEMEAVFDSAGFMGEIIKEAKIYTSAHEEPFRLIIEGKVK